MEGESEVWDIEDARDQEKRAEEERKKKIAEDKFNKENNYDKTVTELYKRILKVDKLI